MHLGTSNPRFNLHAITGRDVIVFISDGNSDEVTIIT